MAGGTVTNPNGTAPDRYVYYPGTEELGADEIRVIACGTGMPTARRSQAAASWVIELGNGDKFIVDIGSGSMANIQSLMIPANFLTKNLKIYGHAQYNLCYYYPLFWCNVIAVGTNVLAILSCDLTRRSITFNSLDVRDIAASN